MAMHQPAKGRLSEGARQSCSASHCRSLSQIQSHGQSREGEEGAQRRAGGSWPQEAASRLRRCRRQAAVANDDATREGARPEGQISGVKAAPPEHVVAWIVRCAEAVKQDGYPEAASSILASVETYEDLSEC